MRMCVFVCRCKGVMEGEREKVDAREIRQVRGSGGGRARDAGCEGGNGMCVCVCGCEGVTEAEPQKMNVREAAICVRVQVRGSDGWRDTERQSERRWMYGRQRYAHVCVCLCVCVRRCKGVMEGERERRWMRGRSGK